MQEVCNVVTQLLLADVRRSFIPQGPASAASNADSRAFYEFLLIPVPLSDIKCLAGIPASGCNKANKEQARLSCEKDFERHFSWQQALRCIRTAGT